MTSGDERRAWLPTTHDWLHEEDAVHIQRIRDERGRYEAGGRRHQILEVLAYADDEAEHRGRQGLAIVRITHDGDVSITDDGRGTDTRRDASGAMIRKPIMATADLRFFESSAPPLLPDGLPRRGMSTVAALSSVLTHENRRIDGAWSQVYRRGRPASELVSLAATSESGTTVTFRSELGAPMDLTDADLLSFRWLDIRHIDESPRAL